MKTFAFLLPLLVAIPTFGQSDPAQVLFDIGIRDEQAGRLERAKLTLVTLAATYQGQPFADKAKTEIGAIYLFLEAQALVQSGKTQDGYATFRLVSRVYPESPLAKLADEAAKSLGIPASPRR